MMRRLRSGSSTPARRSRKRGPASTRRTSSAMRSRKSAITSSASPSRSRPLSTKMQVRRSPRARCTRAATTVESTPPESAHSTRFPPDALADARHPGVDEVLHRPVGTRPADAQHEVAQDLAPVDAVGHLGVELQAVDRPLAVAEGGVRRVVAAGERLEIGAETRHAVAVAHPHARAAAADREQRIHARDADVRRAELLVRGAIDAAAERQVEHVHAVADAEHGRAALAQQLEHLGARRGRVVLVDARRAAREDDARRLEPADDVEPHVEGMDLAVDVELAHAPGDQLRVLRAEVEDEDHYSSR